MKAAVQQKTTIWNRRRLEKERRKATLSPGSKVIPTEKLVGALEQLIAPGDRVILEGNNQKQADFLVSSSPCSSTRMAFWL